MQLSSIAGIIGIGVACGWLIGFVVFRDDSAINKQLISVFGGIVGALAGSSYPGQDFWYGILEGISYAIKLFIELSIRTKISGIPFVPTMLTAFILGGLISVAFKFFVSSK